MAFRREYVETLRLLARAFALYEVQGYERPIIVGGSAVEYYTHGAVESGDFDLVEADERALGGALEAVDFVRENRAGHLLRGFYHPELLTGVEIVSGTLFDGRTDRSRSGVLMLDESSVLFPPVEDLIADRLAQYEASQRQDSEMLGQARSLLELADQLDHGIPNQTCAG
ncbi:hypothetical protein [Benzoatithermus flavus]|uniref:Nucleotidyl transferase AbiEii toxin, Type IV TA system n=1 Tax=Benzoatithermus flavus TaxID=3108223 RepID=A0ABU8XWD9_9PROT